MRDPTDTRARSRHAIQISLVLWLICAQAQAAKPLPAYAADLSQTSLSGVSSGGYMAVQFHVAYSSLVRGVGVLAAGPYACAQRSTWTALHTCMQPDASNPPPEVDALIRLTEKEAQAGRIDATAQLQGDKVWLFSGQRDHTLAPAVMDALARYYQHFVGAPNVVYENTIKARIPYGVRSTRIPGRKRLRA